MNERLLKKGSGRITAIKGFMGRVRDIDYLQQATYSTRYNTDALRGYGLKINTCLLFLIPNVHTGPGTHPPSYSKGNVRVTSCEEEQPGREVNRSLPSSAEGKIEWSRVSTPTYMPLCRRQGQLLPLPSSFSHDNINGNTQKNPR